MRQEILHRTDFVLVIASETVRLVGGGQVPADKRGLRPELDLLRELHRVPEWRRRILPVILPEGRSRRFHPSCYRGNLDHYVVTSFTVAGAASGVAGGTALAVAIDALDEAASDADRRAIADLLAGQARLPRLRVVVAT
jgi:hypothetical protein